MAVWDVIVLGLGGVGSASIRHLAARGCRVLGLEQYEPAHAFGSSHGQSRIIRQAYFEHPSYVPLLRRAYELWDELEQASGRKLIERTGLVEIGPAEGTVIPGVLASAAAHGLTIERLTMDEVVRRWPGISGDDSCQAIVESNAGFLHVENAVNANLQLAQRDDADCRFGVTAHHWSAKGDTVSVVASDGTHHARSLLVAGGAWSGQLLGALEIELQVLRKHLYWFEPLGRDCLLDEDCPCFFHETSAGFFYGFPAFGDSGVKLSRHSGGQPISRPDETPRAVALDESDCQLVRDYARQCLPGVGNRLLARSGCYYTTTPDENFVIDRYPDFPQVIVIAGLSGHGFKFTSVLGEIAAELVLHETQTHDISLFRVDRF